jgi:hypothetical protein
MSRKIYMTLSVKWRQLKIEALPRRPIVLLKKALNFRQERLSRRRQVLDEIEAMNFTHTDGFPDPADLIREDRDR